MYRDKTVTVIIAAAGSGSRMGGRLPKQYMKTGGEVVLRKTASAFASCPVVDEIIVVADRAYMDLCEDVLKGIEHRTVSGGELRQDSVYEGLKCTDTDIVLIHDGARPFVTQQIITEVTAAAAEYRAAVCAVRPKDTIRTKQGTLNRNELYAVQTPQGFDTAAIKAAYEAAYAEGFYGTDDAGIAERAGLEIRIVSGSYDNIKITTREDLPMETRVGTGYDVHRLEEGRKLILGGVCIPFERGLLGHSDADVLVHAIMDALLGAAALGDIGKLFPDTDDRYKGISSIELLKAVGAAVADAGYSVGNIDATLVAEKPKIAPYIETMRENIAGALEIDPDRISVKATTTEKLGFAGRQEGMAAQAVCILNR